jgi:hypothetical protein
MKGLKHASNDEDIMKKVSCGNVQIGVLFTRSIKTKLCHMDSCLGN